MGVVVSLKTLQTREEAIAGRVSVCEDGFQGLQLVEGEAYKYLYNHYLIVTH